MYANKAFENMQTDETLKEQNFAVIPDGETLMSGIAGNFHSLPEIIDELVDNGTSNIRANGGKVSCKTITIELTHGENCADVSVSDGGTGIRDIAKALTISRSCPETPANEHGIGLKHALATVGPDWSIQTRTEEDAAQNRYREVQGPYKIDGMRCVTRSGSGDIGYRTGTVVKFRCFKTLFETLRPKCKRVDPTPLEMTDYLEEWMRVVYAPMLSDKEIDFFLVTNTEDGMDTRIVDEPLEPNWAQDEHRVLEPSRKDLGGGEVTILCEYGQIIGNRKNATFYRGNMATSGVAVRLNGRLIAWNLFEQIWGDEAHNSHNHFLCEIDLRYDDSKKVPPTLSAKNGFREGSELLEELYCWIRTNVEKPKPETRNPEHKLVLELKEKLDQDADVQRATMEESAYESLGIKASIDLFVCRRDSSVTIYEAKRGNSRAENLYQLMMYWDGCARDRKRVTTAVLIAKKHPKQMQLLVEELNRRTDATGRRYSFRLETWADESIVSRDDDGDDAAAA